MPKPLPPVETLRKILRYDPDTGRLFWKSRTPDLFKTTRGKKLRTAEHACRQFNDRFAGTEAFTAKQSGGARVGQLLGKGSFLAHRIAYAIYHGVEVQGEIDHINGDRSDNRIVNLRLATRSEQSRNMPRPCTNTSGRIGVFWISRLNKWGAGITVDGTSHWLGYYDSFDHACQARELAERRFDFHPNHGRETHVDT